MLTRESVIARAHDVGFDLCGIAAADRAPKLGRLQEWVAAGRAGEMSYLAHSLEERLDPARVLPGVRSVIALATLYNTSQPAAGLVSRYAWGDDYHDVLRARLATFVAWLADVAGPGLEAFSSVDTGPVQERVFAERAGLGWIGKNTCLINPRVGSWLFLAEVLTNLDLPPDEPGVDQCGTCTKCLEACPTGALVAPYELDARRCLAYLTIETRGEIDEEWRSAIHDRVFGCDICQDVCPWNRRSPASADPAWQPRPGLASPGVRDLCRMSDDDWRRLLLGSALRRAGLRRLRRSLAYAAASLEPLEARAAIDDLSSHPSADFPEVAAALSWARARLAAAG